VAADSTGEVTVTEQGVHPSSHAKEPVLRFVTHAWSRRVIQPLLIALLTTSLFAGVVIILGLITSEKAWLLMPILGFIVALEGVYTVLWLAHPNQRITDNTAYHAAEVVVIILLTRFYTWLLNGQFPDWQLYETYLRNPFLLFSDQLFWLGLLLILALWARTLSLSMAFARLAIDEGEAHYYLTPKNQRLDDQRPFLLNRIGIVHSFFRQWVYGGIVLGFVATASTFDLPTLPSSESIFAIARLGMPAEMLIALLIYFIAGLLLLSQGRLAAANARWLRDGVAKSKRVERAWHRFSTRLIIFIAFIAALLPIGSTNAIGRILEAMIGTLTALVSLLFLLISGLLSLIIPQVEPAEQLPQTPMPELFPTPAFTPASAPPPNDTAELVFSSAFWALAIVLGIVAISFFLRERGVRINTTQFKQVWSQLAMWLKQMWAGVSKQAAELRQVIQERWQVARKEDEEDGGKRPFRFIRVNALPPREQIRYFYLSTVRRASEKGIERKQSETPLEFAHDLKEELPDAEMDVEALTDAFLKARYSPQPIEKEDVNPVKRRWKQLRANIRRHRKTDSFE
jgi:hypothetical protein